jgi:aspartate/methionine/tyrosine aminotransferase
VAADYARRGVQVPAERVMLTASTSEAYALLFKLLCDPGDRVLVPRPSYPLFEHLTALECVEAVPYDLDAHDGWRLDAGAIRRQIDGRTKAVLVVSPNNPTGSMLDRPDLEALADIAASHRLAIIGDEVFADYGFGAGAPPVSVLQQDRALAFGLGGLSKSAGLPQLKAAWVGASGPAALLDDALAGLEIVADTYLSVSTPVQAALPWLLERGAAIRDAIRARTARNLAALAASVSTTASVTLHAPAGGWSAVLQVPATRSEDALVLALMEQDGILVHPGYFYDFPREAFLVTSLLVEPPAFDTAVAALLARASDGP